MSIFFNYIHELERVPIDTDENNYNDETLDTDSSSEDIDNKENTGDDYNLPDDNADIEDTNTEDNYNLPDDSSSEENEKENVNDPDNEVDNTTPNQDNESDNITTNKDNEVDEIKQLENELFNSLNNSQKNIRDRELVRLYCEMYELITSTIIKIDNIPKNRDNINILEFSNNKLLEVRNILYNYIIRSYNTKSYVENLSNYYEFIATVNGINKVISKLDINDQNKK